MNEIQRSISSIIKGYTIYLCISIASVFVGVALVMSIGMATLTTAFSPDSMVGFNVFAIFGGMMTFLFFILLCVAAIIVSMFMVYGGLKKLAPQLDPIGQAAVNNLAIAMLVSIISNFVAFIPVAGAVLSMCGGIVSIVFSFMGYSALRTSKSLNEEGRMAAKKLFQSMIFYVVALGCILIPIIGWLAIPVFIVLYFVYLFNGWMKLRDSFATLNCEVPNELADHHQ